MTNQLAEYIESLQSLDRILPYRFVSSGAQISGIAVACSRCGAEINKEFIRGKLSEINIHSTALEAYAICYSEGCRTITPIRCHFDSEGGYLSQSEGGWIPGRYAAKKSTGWIGKIKALFLDGGNHE